METKRIIFDLRTKKGLSQEELAERVFVTRQAVSRWETGKYMPDIDKLQELSAILGISIHELLAGERMEDTADFMKKADENLVAVLSNDSTFGLQDRIAYFKRKWLKEHKVLILFWSILWCIVFAVGICMKQPIVLALLPIAGLVIYGCIRNQMMIYVEDRAFTQ